MPAPLVELLAFAAVASGAAALLAIGIHRHWK
jgi:hypothetical protein